MLLLLALSHIQMLSDASAAYTFENIVAKWEIAHYEQFLLLPHCFQRYQFIILSFIDIFHSFVDIFFEVACCRFVVCGKGLQVIVIFNFEIKICVFSFQLLCLIGEAFEEVSDYICGATINIRNKGDKLGVWTRDARHQESNVKIG